MKEIRLITQIITGIATEDDFKKVLPLISTVNDFLEKYLDPILLNFGHHYSIKRQGNKILEIRIVRHGLDHFIIRNIGDGEYEVS